MAPRILITNDDGIDSPGILALVRSLKKLGEIFVVAPDRQQSAVGHALTVSDPLRATPFHRNGEMFGFAINGTPSDCVKLAISSLMDSRPDLLVSGINHGQNTSINVLYSGTVSAATEGMLIGIPSIAVSLDSYSNLSDCTVAAEYAAVIAEKVLVNKLPERTLLNVNVPSINKSMIKGMKVTSLSGNIWNDKYEKRIDPFGRAYYWFAGQLESIDDNPDTDYIALRDKYVSITPIKYKFINDNYLSEMKYIFR